jgi:tRNA-dihydrouridine synthase B
MRIGPYQLDDPLLLAPMAGVTDRPFRTLCRKMGAALAVSEMVTSNAQLLNSRKTQLRLDHTGEDAPRSIQIVGADPAEMVKAAQYNVDNGAGIIDINMGCPKKKVCRVMAGSSLLKNEILVANILNKVVQAVDVPVTLKIRTGWDTDNRNAVSIAKIAESEGIQALAIHGRTRACAFQGKAEYETIAAVKSTVNIPIIANGDINSAEKAAYVIAQTGADAVMIGRAAQGRPWIFREIKHFLKYGEHLPEPGAKEINNILINHLKNLYDFYGETMGVRIARKHIGWYCKNANHLRLTHTRLEPETMHYETMAQVDLFRRNINRVESAAIQLEQVTNFFTLEGRLLAA